MRTNTLGVSHKANTVVSDEVGEVVEVVSVVVFDSLSVVVDAVVVETTVPYQSVPLCPARRYVRTRILVQVLAEVTCN